MNDLFRFMASKFASTDLSYFMNLIKTILRGIARHPHTNEKIAFINSLFITFRVQFIVLGHRNVMQIT